MIHIKSDDEILHIKKSCQILVETFKMVDSIIHENIETIEIDKFIEQFILSRNAKPAFKGYQGFPASSCISIDSEVVHGIPGKRKLKNGQLVSVDIGIEYNNYFGDAAKTYIIGVTDNTNKKLVEVTKQALYKGIEEARPGNRLSNISHAIQNYVEKEGFSVVRELVGHGVGKKLHEEPEIPNYGLPGKGPYLKKGMVLAIEPMVNKGDHQVVFEDDQWTVKTIDNLPSAHFEHTVLITDSTAEILTDGV